ncbi:lytic transglycosylase domain-containing protein [Rhizobium sp. S152]|uniref:lytic transglycosylase domain-containing protein n=1 Tax=Rhizobium sp. S152 TaxID=3055038 RepID=UPI0025A9C0A5|nr:lytic transglycosylase domain-containing protein [Rhizobium sp. S152]MDM9625303.1 lytic transglycosylase domain-containing protein [Rhizobium sp. S152]
MILRALVRAVPAALLTGLPVPATAQEETTASCLYGTAVPDPETGFANCIRQESFNRDLCRTMEHFALRNDLPAPFFARLIWRESLFKPEAVSPKGAEGIAQFMPSTARLRKLSNTFDVVQALEASALYLRELKSRFGNLGLAAAAYNAGENGLQRFLDSGRLPIETRDYVFAITGSTVETSKSDPPALVAPELQDGMSFLDGCIALADTRRMREPVLARSADWAPWGIQLAAHYDPSIAGRLFDTAISRLSGPMSAERAVIVRQRGGNFGYRPRYAARIGRETRAEATRLCQEIKAAGTPCTVFRN